jgi:hypothetical protein
LRWAAAIAPRSSSDPYTNKDSGLCAVTSLSSLAARALAADVAAPRWPLFISACVMIRALEPTVSGS